jgi:hypothetical protein
VGKPAFCGTKNRGIWVSCLQRQRGTINSLCYLPQVIVYYGLVQMNLFHICNKLKYLLATVDFAFQVLLAKLHLCQKWPSRLAWLLVNTLLKAVWNACFTTASTACQLCVCVCVCVREREREIMISQTLSLSLNIYLTIE